MDFKEYLAASREKIKEHLTAYIRDKKAEDLPRLMQEQDILTSLEEFALKGKLLRGTLFLFTIQSLRQKINEKALDIAVAIELMHSALLIQDDIIDNDRVRRGAKTIFTKYEEEGEKIGAYNPYHYGISTGIVSSDVAFFLAMDLLSGCDKEVLNSLLSNYAKEVYLVALAEGADSLFGLTKREPAKEEILDVYKYKTARYTFSLPFELGSIYSRGNEKIRDGLVTLGELVGIVFQLKDDEIGLFGTEESIGKPVGSDIRENKKTIIRYLLYSKSSGEDKKILNKSFGNPNAGLQEVESVKSLYKKYEIQKLVDSEIQKIMVKVWKIYEKLDLVPEYKKILKELLEFNLKRSA